MTDLSLNDAIENIYASLIADNAGLEEHIVALKAAMAREGVKEATFEPNRLAQNNRQGRKLMQSFFKKRGITVVFAG